MGIVKTVLDFVLFKEIVTPIFLKVLYWVIFVLLNLGGLVGLGFVLFTGVTTELGLFGQKADAMTLVGIAVLFLVIAAIQIIFLVVYNLLLRMSFEIVLVMFNIHGYLKNIDGKTEPQKKK